MSYQLNCYQLSLPRLPREILRSRNPLGYLTGAVPCEIHDSEAKHFTGVAPADLSASGGWYWDDLAVKKTGISQRIQQHSQDSIQEKDQANQFQYGEQESTADLTPISKNWVWATGR